MEVWECSLAPKPIHISPLFSRSFESIHIFAGFWPSPCLLPDSVGADPSSLLASESAGCSVQPAHLEGEAELLDVAVVPGLASPASQPSDGSPQAGVPAAEQPDPAELKHNHGRGAQARDPSPRSNTQQGAALPGNTEPEHEREQAGSRLTAKRNRDDAYDGSPSDPDNQRPYSGPEQRVMTGGLPHWFRSTKTV